MKDQLELFGVGAATEAPRPFDAPRFSRLAQGDSPKANRVPFVRGSVTSELAARRLEGDPGRRVTALGRVMDAIAAAGDAGLTDEEIQRQLDMNPNTQRPRRIELARMGLISRTGGTRATASGHPAEVWVAVEDGTSGVAP